MCLPDSSFRVSSLALGVVTILRGDFKMSGAEDGSGSSMIVSLREERAEGEVADC